MRSSILIAALSFSTAASAETLVPDPVAPEPRVVVEDTPGPSYYRNLPDRITVMPRASVGLGFRTSVADHESDTALTLDLLLGAAIRVRRGGHVGGWIEGGYSYSRFHDHLLMIGAGPSLRMFRCDAEDCGHIGLALVPHAVLGSIDGERGSGIRTSLVASFASFGIELAHQYVAAGSRGIHEVHVMATFGGKP